MIAQHVPEIVASLIEAAKRGDIGAARLLLERTIPPLRAEELPVDIQGFAGTRAELVKAIVAAVASGQLDTHRGGHLIAMLEPSELDERISRVERRYSEANDER